MSGYTQQHSMNERRFWYSVLILDPVCMCAEYCAAFLAQTAPPLDGSRLASDTREGSLLPTEPKDSTHE